MKFELLRFFFFFLFYFTFIQIFLFTTFNSHFHLPKLLTVSYSSGHFNRNTVGRNSSPSFMFFVSPNTGVFKEILQLQKPSVISLNLDEPKNCMEQIGKLRANKRDFGFENEMLINNNSSIRQSANKGNLIAEISSDLNLPKTEVMNVINAFLKKILMTTFEDKKVSLAGFGTFYRNIRITRTGRNPKTGETLNLPDTAVLKFNPLRSVRNRIKQAVFDTLEKEEMKENEDKKDQKGAFDW